MSDTTLRDQLAQIIEDHRYGADIVSVRAGITRVHSSSDLIAAAVIAAGWRPPARTVSTVEEVEALRDGTLVVTRMGGSGYVWRDHVHATYPAFYHLRWAIEHYGPLTVVWEPKGDE